MALIRVAQYNSTPTVVGDYQAQNAHLQAFTNQLMTQQFILDAGTAQPVIKQGCYVSHGGSLYIADADTAITGSPADGSVYIRVSGTTSLTVEFVNDISGYVWNPVYTALTSGSYTLLPYLIVKASTVWTRYNFNPNNQQFGNIAVLGTLNGATITEWPSKYVFSSFASPSANPIGLTFDGTNLISYDYDSYMIYIHNGVSSTILSSFASPTANPSGLTFDGTNLISCDSGADRIYIHDGISSTILSSFASPSANPSGLTFDGTNLISCDNTADRIYIHDGISSTILSSFASPGASPTGLTFDGTNLISCDYDSDMIYIHNGVSSTILSSFASPGASPTGLTFDGTNLISCDNASDMIYIHRTELKFLL